MVSIEFVFAGLKSHCPIDLSKLEGIVGTWKLVWAVRELNDPKKANWGRDCLGDFEEERESCSNSWRPNLHLSSEKGKRRRERERAGFPNLISTARPAKIIFFWEDLDLSNIFKINELRMVFFSFLFFFWNLTTPGSQRYIWSGKTADWNCPLQSPPPLPQVLQSKTRVGRRKPEGKYFHNRAATANTRRLNSGSASILIFPSFGSH